MKRVSRKREREREREREKTGISCSYKNSSPLERLRQEDYEFKASLCVMSKLSMSEFTE
jgi:hypothetical protein